MFVACFDEAVKQQIRFEAKQQVSSAGKSDADVWRTFKKWQPSILSYFPARNVSKLQKVTSALLRIGARVLAEIHF